MDGDLNAQPPWYKIRTHPPGKLLTCKSTVPPRVLLRVAAVLLSVVLYNFFEKTLVTVIYRRRVC